jgi:type I restriction enzyme, S subunit
MTSPAGVKRVESGVPWVESIPAHWRVMPFMAVFSETKERNVGLHEQNLLSLSYGRIVRKSIDGDHGLLPDSFETYQIVERDALIFRLTDLQNDQRSLRTARARERGIITSAYGAARPVGILPNYAEYLLRSYDNSKVFYGFSGGVRQSLKMRDLARMPVIMPPEEEQRALSDYLDRETARIDTLIAKQEQLIKTLLERRGAVLDALTASAAKPRVPLRHVAETITVGIVVQPSKWYQDVGVPALRGTNVKPEALDLDDLVFLSDDGHRAHAKSELRAGDVVVVRTGKSGAAAVVPANLGTANAIDLLIVRPGPGLSGDYLAMVLNAPSARELASREVVGTIQAHLNVGALRSLDIPFPPLDVQVAMVDEWRARAAKIDALVAKAERFIELSKERRAALITAVVTGQIDVTRKAA